MKIRKKLLILIPIILTALFITLLVVSRIPDPLFPLIIAPWYWMKKESTCGSS